MKKKGELYEAILIIIALVLAIGIAVILFQLF